MSAPRIPRVAPVVDRTVALPIDARVMRIPVEPCSCCGDPFGLANANRRRPALFGTVMPYDEKYSRGSFSVRWDNGIWEAGLDVSSVTAVSQEATVTALPTIDARTKRAAS